MRALLQDTVKGRLRLFQLPESQQRIAPGNQQVLLCLGLQGERIRNRGQDVVILPLVKPAVGEHQIELFVRIAQVAGTHQFLLGRGGITFLQKNAAQKEACLRAVRIPLQSVLQFDLGGVEIALVDIFLRPFQEGRCQRRRSHKRPGKACCAREDQQE